MPYVKQWSIAANRVIQRQIKSSAAVEFVAFGMDVRETPFDGVPMATDWTPHSSNCTPQASPYPLPPHFPDPAADPVAVLEARIVELEEINAAQYAEMTAWRAQLEAALERLASMDDVTDQMVVAGLGVYIDWLDDDASRRPLDEANLMETIFRAMLERHSNGVLLSK